MKRINQILMTCLVLAGLTACTAGAKKQSDNMDKEVRTQVRLETTMGNITLELFNETPLHRDNFIKLVKEGVYDSTLFHRVIKDFMIQGGDPDSKHAEDSGLLGEGGVGYTVPAEFREGIFHRKGVLAAAREGDDVNPERASSGSQFYIVVGRVFTELELERRAVAKNEQRQKAILDTLKAEHAKELYTLRKAGKKAEFLDLQDKLEEEAYQLASQNKFAYTPEQIQAYTTVGGTPHLDGAYTVYGEVISGMEVAENISIVQTDRANRPKTNVRILSARIVE